MSGDLYDTNILSESRKLRPDPRVTAWAVGRRSIAYISVLTVGEIMRGIARLPAGARRETYWNWLETEVVPGFAGRILPINEQVARAWGELCGRNPRDGYSLPAVDSLLAATALVHDLTIVTRNSRDFERCGVPVENPWGDPPA